ncbi:hypothetical protein MJA45_25290 [Paenibacillus aurantius]|uniref:Uncharacterized protein n=1 Tax=Paenibacillus aurantius TaxID=2918900 RepID=A0AA96LCY7_9BACL|nr:hypothetical protein [Paenibacillus aurantius]WNQ10894.1 hypothetical protein MJA45_25290 [Paenibacillus aurantius]
MNRYTFHIVTSVVTLLIPVVGVIYGYWDQHRPRLGPVGDGHIAGPSPIQWMVLGCAFLTGILNLALAIHRYRSYRNQASPENREGPLSLPDEE